MEIIINGKLAWLKKNTSFEYIAENPLFTGSDGYSLTITFPLKDCPDNIAIFGHLHRHDVEKSKVVFDCEIRDKQFYKSGCITVTQISDVEVKTQFLEGRSEQNYNDTFDNIYLNQLSLGYPENVSSKNVDLTEMCEVCYPYCDYTALPWVNNTSGNLQNAVKKNQSGEFEWDTDNLSFQPYLVPLLEKICKAINYTGSFSAIKNSKWKYLLVCNALPEAWAQRDYAAALPHWSLTEFFEQLELFLRGEFTINHKSRTIVFEFSSTKARKSPSVYISNVVNKYSVDVTQDNKCDYIATKNLIYADNDNRLWAYRSCQWYIDKHKNEAVVYSTLNSLLTHAATLKESGVYITSEGNGTTKKFYRGYPNASDGNKLFYAKDVDTYFIMYCYKSELYETNHIQNTDYHWYKYYNKLIPINQFGKFLFDKDAEDVELNIVPAWIDDTEDDLGPCVFLECGDLGSAVSYTKDESSSGSVSGGSGNRRGGTRGEHGFYGERGRENDDTDYDDGALAQGTAGRTILKGDLEKNDAYFDKIYVAFWDGTTTKEGKLPHPIVDKVETFDDFTKYTCSYSMRLEAPKGLEKYTYDIDNKKKYTFSFLSDVIPDPRAVFFIEGSRYVCEKITATFQESTGKSQLLKGVFYRII
jgi:hypothetical protein